MPVAGQGYGRRENYFLCVCPTCAQLVVYQLATDPEGQIGPIVGDPYFSPERMGMRVVDFWPKPPAPVLPGGLPSQVAKAFMQAEGNFHRKGMEEVAAGAYGRALDVGTKLIAPDFKGLLDARIRHLAETGRITADLADWAHEIRTIRNDALHEVDGIDRHELTAIRGLADMVLRYLFTLPEMVKARKAEAKAA